VLVNSQGARSLDNRAPELLAVRFRGQLVDRGVLRWVEEGLPGGCDRVTIDVEIIGS
jgi:hypothetical protein